jgi:putative ubiquitin-RnfH superfamily antitoxin RatB of RatAB toxin-antitoxin module
MLAIEVVYALPSEQRIVRVALPAGATVADAIAASGLPAAHPEIDLARNKVGVWMKLVKLDTPLRDRDRVEIYRPLIADPKAVRKQRAAEGKAMKKGAGEGETAGDDSAPVSSSGA